MKRRSVPSERLLPSRRLLPVSRIFSSAKPAPKPLHRPQQAHCTWSARGRTAPPNPIP